MNREEFLKAHKVLRLATVDKSKTPHITPVWYMYTGKKIYVGTSTKTKKVRNIKANSRVSFCVDVGVNAPNIYGVMSQGNANLILTDDRVKTIAKKILSRYYRTLNNKSARQLLEDTDCIIEIIPEKFSVWNY